MSNNTRLIKEYYRTSESRLGYKVLLRGVRHFGYYPTDQKVSHQQAQINMMDQVALSFKLSNGSKILDAGCGEGATAIHLAKKYGYDVTGVDLLEESIKIAKAKSKDSSLPINFLVGNFTRLPFKDNSFDGLYAIETFIHSSDPLATLAEFKRVLKPGGRLVIADYTWEASNKLPKRYRKVLDWVAIDVAVPGALIINPGWYEKSLSSNKFKNIQVRNITTNLTPMINWFWQMALIPYQITRLLHRQSKYINTTMGYYGKKFASEGWWQYVIVSATK